MTKSYKLAKTNRNATISNTKYTQSNKKSVNYKIKVSFLSSKSMTIESKTLVLNNKGLNQLKLFKNLGKNQKI